MEKIRNTYCRIYTFVYIPLRLLLKINNMKKKHQPWKNVLAPKTKTKRDKKYRAKIYAAFLSYLGMLITIIYIIIKSHCLTT